MPRTLSSEKATKNKEDEEALKKLSGASPGEVFFDPFKYLVTIKVGDGRKAKKKRNGR